MDEDRDVVEAIAKEGQMVNATIKTRGWTDVIRPTLEKRIASFVKEFAEAVTYEEFIRIQQGMKAVGDLLDFIEVKLIEGKSALEDLGREI